MNMNNDYDLIYNNDLHEFSNNFFLQNALLGKNIYTTR